MAEQTKKPETELIKFGDKEFVETFNKYEAKQRELVKENPFIKVVDNETWEIGKQRRTALRTGRTTLENESKEVVRKINSFKDWVKGKYQNFVSISVDPENKQQESVKAYEAIKEAEKEKELQAEQNRIDGIDALINECSVSFDKIIDEMTFSTIDDSREKFQNTANSEHYGSDKLMEREFLFNEMVERYETEFDKQAEKLVEAEHKRIEDLKVKQQSMINELYVKANKIIDEKSDDAMFVQQVQNVFELDFDFGEFTDKFKETRDELVKKANDKRAVMIKEAEEKEEKEREQKLAEQKNKIAEIREGLLDMIFQIDVDNYKKQNELIGKTIKNVTGLDDELKPEWNKMVGQVEKQLAQKMQFIDGQLKERERQVEAHAKKVDEREKELIAIGFEKDDDVLSFNNESDFNVSDDSLWNMSDTEFDTLKADVEAYKEENRIHNERWDSRKPELESIGFEYHEKDERFRHHYPQTIIPLSRVLESNDDDWKIYRSEIDSRLKDLKESDKKEKARQERIATDKENLIKAVKSVRFQPSQVENMENESMFRLLEQFQKDLDTWREQKIEQIKNF